LLWYAGKQLIHGKIHEPNFYGQNYNTTFEAGPGAVLHHFGVPLNVAIPLGTMLLVTIVWVLLALMAYRKGKHNIALLALAAPVIMRIQYLVLFDAPRGILAGDLLAVVAVACAIWWCKDGLVKLASLLALGGVAVLWDYSAALIIVPIFVYIVCQEWTRVWRKPMRSLLFGIVSVIPPVVWLLSQRWWYSTHPYDLTAFDVSVVPSLTVFLKNIRHFNSYLSFFAPAIIPYSNVAAILLAGLLTGGAWIGLKRKSYKLFLSTLSLIVLICLTLSLPRAAHHYPNLYLSAPRLILTLPIGAWLLIFLISLDKDDNKNPPGQKQDKKSSLAMWLLVVIAAASFIIMYRSFDSTLAASNSLDIHSGSLVNPVNLLGSCTRKHDVYKSTNAQLFATTDSNLVYGCAAQYSNFNTLEPSYDRRGWLINKSYNEPLERILISGISCKNVSKKAGKCSVQDDNLLLIQTPPTNPAITLSLLGLPVKNFSLAPF
jgi:hypothetical protein